MCKRALMTVLFFYISRTLDFKCNKEADTHVFARISACLAGIPSWTGAHQLKLILKCCSSLLVLSQDNFHISHSVTAHNLGVTRDNQLLSSHTFCLNSCIFQEINKYSNM